MIVFTTLFVFGLMRDTVRSAWFDAHTEPKPKVTSHGLKPTLISFLTRSVAGSTRRIAFSLKSSIQSDPLPDTRPHMPVPMRRDLTTLFVAGSSFDTTPLP